MAAAALTGSLLLGGCASSEAGAAATVGDHRISVAEVQSGYHSIVELAGPDAGFTQSIILNYLILEPYLDQVASEMGRGVSADDARHQFNIDASLPAPSAAALKVMRALAANQAIRSGRTDDEINRTYQQVSDRLKADGVHINPRYGAGLQYKVGDQAMLTILPEKQDWIASTPQPSSISSSPEPAPSP